VGHADQEHGPQFDAPDEFDIDRAPNEPLRRTFNGVDAMPVRFRPSRSG